MSSVSRSRKSRTSVTPYDRNAQHGQNRAGVDVQDDLEFDEYEGAQPIDPRAADERERDEGPKIRKRVHDRGHDIVIVQEE